VASHASALKAHRQSVKHREHNREFRSKLRTALKSIRSAMDAKDVDGAHPYFPSRVAHIPPDDGRVAGVTEHPQTGGDAFTAVSSLNEQIPNDGDDDLRMCEPKIANHAVRVLGRHAHGGFGKRLGNGVGSCLLEHERDGTRRPVLSLGNERK